MAQTGYQAVIIPGQQRFLFSPEANYGVQGATAYLEPVTSIVSAIQRSPYTPNELTGVPASTFGMIDTTHHTTITITTPFRANGFAAWALAALMGSKLGGALDQAAAPGTPAPTAAPPSGTNTTSPGTWGTALPAVPHWNTVQNGAVVADSLPVGANAASHLITPNYASNICNTFTIWHDTGDGKFTSGQRGYLEMGAATVESIAFAFTPASDLACTITLQANFPKFRGISGSTATANAPTGTIVPVTQVGNANTTTLNSTRMMGFQGVKQYFSFYGSSNNGDTPLVYQNAILSGDMTITRTIEVLEAPYQQNPIFFLPGELSTTGTLTMLFDGLGDLNGMSGTTAGTFTEGQSGMTNFVDASATTSGSDPTTAFTNSVYQDYLAFKDAGSSTEPIELQFQDYQGFGFDIKMHPVKYNSFTLNATAQSLQASVGFQSFNDIQAAIPANSTNIGRVTAVDFVYIVNQIAAGTMIQ